MKKVLLIGPYPPLFSYGGPTRSISALHDSLKKNFNITILSPKSNLDGTKNEKITNTSKSFIFTDSPVVYLLQNYHKYDIIWLNSFFNFNHLFLLLLSHTKTFDLVISPRGELSKRAINSSNIILKYIFILITKCLKRENMFHATSQHEEKDILNYFKNSRINYIPNLFNHNFNKSKCKDLNFVFYSRLHKIKGLEIILDYIKINNLKINLDIYGFIEDKVYWDRCYKKIKSMENVNYIGTIEDGEINLLRDKYTFFIAPTLTENFGHSIIEMISLGFIPIISKNTTPFEQLTSKFIGLNFDLYNIKDFVSVIKKINLMTENEIFRLKSNVNHIFVELNKRKQKEVNKYIKMLNSI